MVSLCKDSRSSGRNSSKQRLRQRNNSPVAQPTNAAPVNHFPSGGPELWEADGSVLVPIGSSDDCGAECVSAKISDHKCRHLRVTFVGQNAHIWKHR